MILVTGAGGKTGRAVIAALARAGAGTRALVRRPSQIDELLHLGASQALVGDLRDTADVRDATAGTRAIYHICPNVDPDEVAIGQSVIAAAQGAGVERFVFHSVLHPQTEAMPHHWRKARVEEAIFESGLGFTLLQPTTYMQNLLGGWDLVLQGRLRNPYPVETRLGLVDLEDVAEAAAIVLLGDEHRGATYELVGTPPLTQIQIAETLSEALGRPVRAEAESREEWQARALEAGLSEHARTTLEAMFRYYERYGLVGNPNVLRWLLGREPTTLDAFAARHRV